MKTKIVTVYCRKNSGNSRMCDTTLINMDLLMHWKAKNNKRPIPGTVWKIERRNLFCFSYGVFLFSARVIKKNWWQGVNFSIFFQQSNIESWEWSIATDQKLNQNTFPKTMHIFFNFWRLVEGLITAPWKLNDRLNGDMTLPRCMRKADRAKRLCGEIPGGDIKTPSGKTAIFSERR